MTSIIDLDKFHERTIGLPDHVFLDEKGDPSVEVLRRSLGFNRSDSRNTTRFEKRRKMTLNKFYSAHSERSSRAIIFWRHAGYFRKKELPRFINDEHMACWESQVFDHILPGWHLLDSKKGDASLYSALSDANKNEIEAWFNEYVPLDALSVKNNKILDALSDKNNNIPDIGIKHDQLMACSAEVYLRFLAALDGWENCDSGRRRELAEVAFACFTVFGPSALNCAATKVPELLDYYNYVRGIARPPKKDNTRGNEKPGKDVRIDDTDTAPLATLTAVPSTLTAFYGQLFDLAERGKAAPFNGSIADEMEQLLQHFSQLKKNIGISDDIIRNVFDAFVDYFTTLGTDRSLSEFEKDDFLTAFKDAWFEFLNTQLQTPVSVSFFDDLTTHATSAFEVLSPSITQLRERIRDLGLQITKSDKECNDSGFKGRRELQKAIAALTLEKSEHVSELAQIEERAILALLPAGMTIDDLPSGNEEVVLSNSQYHPDAIIAIKARHDAAATSRTEDDEIVVAAVAESKSPVAVVAHAAPIEIGAPPSIVPESIPPVASVAVQAPESVLSIKSVANEIKTTVENSSDAPEKAEGSELVQETVAVENISVDTIDIAEPESTNGVITTDYLEDAVDTSAFFVQSHENRGSVSAVAVENVALHWLELGYLNFAHAVLDEAENVSWVDGRVLGSSLIRAAYFGSHVWPGDQTGISIIQKQLNFISHQLLEESLNRRPGGKLVPYLIFCASFQASIFSGNYTNAPRLLEQVGEYFDNATQRMIADIVSFCNRGHRLDLESLRMKQPIEDEKTQIETLRLRLSDWRDRIINKLTGWAPARKAMYDCLSLPDFMETISAIENTSSGSSATVESFVENYADLSTINSLIESQISKVQNGAGFPIERNARVWFQKNIEEISEIARDWLIDNRNRLNRNTDTQMFAERLLTQLRSAQAEFQAMVKRAPGLEHRCGSNMALQCVTNLLRAIEGDTSVIWPAKRVSATFNLADDLFAIDGLKDDSEAQLHWLAENISKPFYLEAVTKRAELARDFRVAQLLLMLRKDRGDDVVAELQEVKKQSDRDRYLLRQKADRVQTMVHNAALANLIEDDRAYQLSADNDYLLEQINSLDALDSVRDLDSDVDAWERDLLSRFSGEITKKRDSLDDLLRKARVQFGEEAVPDEWLQQITRALDSQNLSVAEEMLSQLESSIKEGSKVAIEDIAPNHFITGFLAAEQQLFNAITSHPNPREIGKYLLGNPINGLDFSNPQSKCTDALEKMAEWRSRPKKSLEQVFYDSLVFVLEYIGFQVANKTLSTATTTSLGYEQGPRFKRASVTVSRSDTGRPFPLFEDTQGGTSQINVIMAFSDWNEQDLKGYLETLGLHNRTLLLSAKPMTNAERNEFATFCKKNEITVFHIDPVIAAYMGSLPSNDKRLRNFLFLSAPWTYYNPYTQGDVRRPAPYEMRYGRQNDVQNLTQRGGNAIVFGGRQLGKTTILYEAVRVFHNPAQRQFAYYRQMDRDMARLDAVSKDAWISARVRVWEEIYNCVVEAKILPKNHYSDLESLIKAIGDEFKKDGPTKILICMDEIDPILKLDHANGFRIFRGVSELVNQPNGRFRVVIAGLENVKRFEDAPNFPLPQLGGSLQVSILQSKEAMQLVNEPLRILGYEFDDDLLAASILFTTNRHPGLIHIFCAELLKWMSRRHKDAVGKIKITANDVDRIVRDPMVNKLIRSRFDMTLNLDKRYLVIIYSLINSQRSTGYFTSSQAKVTSEYWLPEVFKPMTEKTFEAFLDELVGLGVLRQSVDGREFALRSVNILKLVGNQTEIEEKLLQAIADINFDDPMSGHSISEVGSSNAQHLSPLTFRDEKFLISATASEMRANPDRTKMYSVAVVAGSEAMGLDVEKFTISLPSLGNFENTSLLNRGAAYEIKHKTEASLKGATGFRTLLENLIQQKTQHAAHPIMLLIEVDGSLPLSLTLDLIDIAHEATSTTTTLKSQVRVLFLLNPRALWQWEFNSALTKDREPLQTFICLDRWSKTALEYLLSNLGLVCNVKEVALLLDYSQGWYYSLNQLLQVCSRYKRPRQNLTDLTAYVSFENENSKRLLDFANKTGVTQFEWAPSILLSLARNGTFDPDDVEIAIMDLETKYAIDATMAPAILRWFERLRVVDPMSAARANRGTITYRVNPSIVTALKEVSQAGTTL